MSIPVAVHLCKPQAFELLHADGTLCRVESLGLNFSRIAAVPNLYYPYDQPGAVFVLLILFLLLRLAREGDRRLLAALLVSAALAAVNRETAVLAIPLTGALLFRRVPGRTLLWVVIAQVTMFAAIQAGLKTWFPGQPNPYANIGGSAYELNLVNNLRTVFHPLFWVFVAPVLAGGTWLPLWLFRRRLSVEMRRALVFYAVPSLAMGFLFGQVLEMRVFVEAVPVIWLAAVQATTVAWRE